MDSGLRYPIRIAHGDPSMSHLLLADDVLLFCKATDSQVRVVIDTLQEFCKASGLKVSFEKSRAMCSSRVPRYRKEAMAGIANIRVVDDLGTYLGFPLVKGRVNKNTYNAAIEKVQRRMASWKNKLLNKAGRLCLAKSVTSSIPIYSMHTHYLPQSVCNRIDTLTRSFV